ncbi:Cadmium, zinc and cobalt-transporting ATPase [Collinsella intestinalis]|nr:Cadmium, zinc and cobalt-transporting ATPase [Collinsella intestinalis]
MQVGDIIVVKPGERVPIDGVVVDGTSQLDTAALTGESVPRHVEVGGEVISGCINMTGVLRIRTTKLFGASTVSRILELVENASEKKARTENFITRFARVYTPIVTLAAVAIAVVPPLLGMGAWADWILRGLTFLVVSCPCALVISVPLSFFGGIGGASRLGILVKGSNYLEALSEVDAVVFDKTGTLTSGTFGVVGVHPAGGIDGDQLLAMAAHAEAFSDHPIALSVKKAYLDEASADSERIIDQARIEGAAEESGHGVKATVDGHAVLVGNDKLMSAHGISCPDCELTGTILHVAIDGAYAGHIVIADTVKDDAAQAIADLHAAGVERCIMLTGDREEVARSVASDLGLDEYHAQLLPGDKVEQVERILDSARGNLAFVGDGINDAPVLTRADVGIAMGAMGSDAAIEAADIVLMDDKPSNIARAIRVARKTMRIVHQNIVFAIGVKLLILALAAVGIANMWLAVFGDVGVAVIAILNAMRAMNVKDC